MRRFYNVLTFVDPAFACSDRCQVAGEGRRWHPRHAHAACVRGVIGAIRFMLRALRHTVLMLLATTVVVGGSVLLGWSLAELVQDTPTGSEFGFAALFALAAVVCARFPIRLGLGSSFVSLDSIPFVLAAALLPLELAVVVAVACVGVALLGQPMLPGVRGWFWRSHATLAAGIAMAAASSVSGFIHGTGNGGHVGQVLLVEAFLVALALEVSVDLGVVLELETEESGAGLAAVSAWTPLAANILLPTAAVAMLSPYADDRAWLFALLLPVLLVAMYGALWVANSQQLEKRRGERLRDTFSRYVPEGIVDDNLETMQRVELGGEQHDVSVLFCDIRGFTSWSEDKGATEVITELNVLLTELSASVMSTGGTLDKFTGDGLMAFWGAPVPTEDHAARAAAAALDMLCRLDGVNARRAADGQAPFAIGVAVHSGPAVVGNVGHERRLDYTAIGDTVNTAARLEAATKEMGAALLVSRSTVDLLDGELRAAARLLGDVVMKGKQRPVEAWALDATSLDHGTSHGDGGVAA